MKPAPPRASLTIDFTESLMPIIEETIKMTVEVTLAQMRKDQKDTKEPEMLTLQEAADRLKISVQSLAGLRKSGVIKTTEMGPQVRISSLEIDKFHKAQ